jgi:glutathione synthase/RimK-type ligase-like ATP-grasp enzyme
MLSVQSNIMEKLSKVEIIPPPNEQNTAVLFSPSRLLVIVERRDDWRGYLPTESIVTAQEYLEDKRYKNPGGQVQIINLCRSYKYLGHGYYCSLLAEARGHKVIPSVKTISELTKRSLYGLALEDLDRVLDQAIADHPCGDTEGFTLSFHFGKTDLVPLQGLAEQLFNTFPCPVLNVEFVKHQRWHIAEIKIGVLHKLREEQQHDFATALDSFNRRIWRQPSSLRRSRYDLAILHDPAEALAPSNPQALERFVEAGQRLGVQVELIEKKDYARLAEYDALFIRETTSVADHTYRFAKKAESEGLVVMDDPASILRCTNKVFLTDLLNKHGLGMPATEILYRDRMQDLEQIGERLGFPVVLKIPDGCFSRGVIKVESQAELSRAASELFQHSVLLLAQEYLYTEFDWRIGVLNRQPLYACLYFMSKGHWQIYNHKAQGSEVNGLCETVPIEDVPAAVVKLAVDAASLIGDGLYGVDLKQTRDRLVVIEVNDNPNLDAGIEDACIQDRLYERILNEFIRRLELKHQAHG